MLGNSPWMFPQKFNGSELGNQETPVTNMFDFLCENEKNIQISFLPSIRSKFRT